MIRLLFPSLPILMAHAFAGLSMLWLLLVIVPGFTKTFDDLGVDLSAATRLVIWLSDLVVQYWYALVPLLSISDLVAVVVLQQFRERRRWMIWAWFGLWLFVALAFFVFAVTALFVPAIRTIDGLR